MEKCSLILVNYKRPKEIGVIIGSLKGEEWIDEVLVWDNTSKMNVGVLGRYNMALQASNNLIVTQDDDNIVLNYPAIFSNWDGTHLCNARKSSHCINERWGNGWETFVAQGGFFLKEWVSVLDKYIQQYGEDQVLFNQADRIFAALLQRKHNTIPADIIEFSSAWEDGIAMYKQEGYNERLQTAKARVEYLTGGKA